MEALTPAGGGGSSARPLGRTPAVGQTPALGRTPGFSLSKRPLSEVQADADATPGPKRSAYAPPSAAKGEEDVGRLQVSLDPLLCGPLFSL